MVNTEKLTSKLFETITHAFTLTDTDLGHLQQAGLEVVEDLKSNRKSLIPMLLAAIDPNIDEDNPFLDLAEERVKTHWKTLRSAHKVRPVALLRYVLLHGIVNHCGQAPNSAAMAHLTLVDVAKHQVESEPKKILSLLLEQWKAKQLELAEQRFASPYKTPPVKPGKTSVPVAKDFSTTLQKGIQNALVNGKTVHAQLTGNFTAEWATEASKRLATALTTAFTNTVKDVETVVDTLNATHEQNSKKLMGQIKDTAVANRQINLLWWMQSRYSEFIGCRYRTLDEMIAAVVMVEDIKGITSHPATPGVEALLEETLYSVYGQKTEEPRLLGDLLQHLSGNKDVLTRLPAAVYTPADGKITLRDAVKLITGPHPPDFDQLGSLLGVPMEASLTPSELALWYLHNTSAAEFI